MILRGEPDSPAIVSSNGVRLTYQALAEMALHLGTFGVSRRAVLVLAENSAVSVSTIAALLEIGAIPILLNSKTDDAAVTHILETYEPPFVFGSFERLTSRRGLHLIFRDSSDNGLFSYDQTRDEVKPHEELGLLLTTSGSTGNPKLVRISRTNLIENATSIATYLNITNDERALLHLPISYTYGLSILTSHLWSGATVLVTEESIISRSFWEFATQEMCTSLPGVPYTYSMLKKLRFTSMNIPTLQTLTQAGGRLGTELQAEFAEWATKNNRQFFVMYGQTEATARMSYLPSKFALSKLGSIGVPIPGGTFSILDSDGQLINEPYVSGNLRYSGPNVALGYAYSDQDLAEGDLFQGHLSTGDVAYRDEDGFFFLVGRSDRYVKMFGNRILLDDIEKIVGQVHSQVACVGREDLISIFLFGEDFPTESAVKKLIAQKTNINGSGFKVRNLDEVPLNRNGKIDYQELFRLSQ